MLVTFSCDAHANITMFGDVAQRLLKMMGHSGTVPSAILAEDVPEALDRLKQGVGKNKGTLVTHHPMDDDDGDIDVSLSNRALPLIELLQDAVDSHCNVMWRAG